MAGAKIDFTDATGAATLQGFAGAGSDLGKRFRNWLPDGNRIGVEEIALADGVAHRWEFRTDYTASLEIPGLTGSQLEIAIRLKLHLIDNGSVTLTTDDTASRTYTAKRAPGTVPTVSGPDDNTEYTFSGIFKNAAAAVMRATYHGPSS